MNNRVIAIASPSNDAYSETFIRAHKNYLPGNVLFYYGDLLPNRLEGEKGMLIEKMGLPRRFAHWAKRRVVGLDYSHTLSHALLTSFRENSVDVVLAEYGPTAVSVMNACKQGQIPLVVHFHGYDASLKSVLTQYSDDYRTLFKFAEKIIVVSKKMQSTLTEMGADAKKIVRTACAPDDSFFKITPNYASKNFLSIGRFVDKKAPYYTVLAFSRIAKNFPEARLIMVGEGSLLNATKNVARSTGVLDQIDFVGAQSPEIIREYLANSIAYVQHSVTAENGDSEGTPVAILEAGAAGLPLVSTKHAGIADTILHEKTGFLVDEHDVASMSHFMGRLLAEPGLAEKLGKASKEHTWENYRMSIHIQTINSAIDEALAHDTS